MSEQEAANAVLETETGAVATGDADFDVMAAELELLAEEAQKHMQQSDGDVELAARNFMFAPLHEGKIEIPGYSVYRAPVEGAPECDAAQAAFAEGQLVADAKAEAEAELAKARGEEVD